MITCVNCGQENPEGFRLCGMCGASLVPETAAREERKVVTCLFCDLVGFTARAEAMDPEDVRRVLQPYHARLRAELERHGGTVEKFIGDAVMAVFGAPTAHEDDPERAVRAALAIREAFADEDLDIRIGVTTGEALVTLGARPEEGEGMASGDVVNTAARLQAGAPVNAVLVDETTYRATRHVIEHEETRAVEAKGKSEPIPVWQAKRARTRFGVDVAHEARSALVGRDRELRILRDAFERAVHDGTPQLVTLVGVPGIGKSRLVYELSEVARANRELITWRQGRCLAYGEGVTLWALGEIVKAQAGILEQDAPVDVEEKVRATVDALLDERDAPWVQQHLLSLVGLGEETELGGDRRNEAFAAWRRFLEALAELRPLVLVFEDLHCADETLLDFVDELVDWVTDVPLLVVGTARPELLDRRPGWGGGKLNATTLALSPLSDEQTAHLISALLDHSVLPAESQQTLLERACGNPLYAEQFADLFVERGSAAELSLPETLQGIISARLDGLPVEEKGLLQDAAILGKVFWPGGLQRPSDETTHTLHLLERKGFVRRQRRSSVEGESEFAFAHALVRDVAYGQIARADRADKHRRVAEWIESLGRREDHAEMLSYHWTSALELTRATGRDDSELTDRARLALREAGDRAFALNSFRIAAAQYEEALALWPDDAGERPGLLSRYAHALHWAYDERQESALEMARDALLASGDMDGAAEAEALLARVFWDRGQGERAREHLSRAEELAGDSVSRGTARVLAFSARIRAIAGEPEYGLRVGEAALAMAEELGLDELRAHALTTIGMTKNDLGDSTGTADIERGLELAIAIDSPAAATITNNLAVQAIVDGDLPRTDELYAEALRLAERFGDSSSIRFIGGSRIWVDYIRGRWTQALAAAETFIAECEAGSPHTLEFSARLVRGSIREGRGDAEGALADHLRAIELAREREAPQQVVGALSICAATHAERGELDAALALVEELIPLVSDHGINAALSVLAWFAVELGIADELRKAIDEAPGPRGPRWWQAIVLGLDGDYRGAGDLFALMGAPTREANARLFAGQRLLETQPRAEAEVELERALAFFRSVDAAYYVEKAERLLAEAQRESA